MIDFIISNINILGILVEDCTSFIGEDFYAILKEVFTAIQIAVPCLVVVLCSVDMVQAVVSQDDKSMKNAQGKAIKRIIIGAAIFFVPLLLDILLDLSGLAIGTCSLG